MATLLIPLVGPLQAWGLDARFDLRQTALEPSKSAVLGLMCCCLGRDRFEPIDDLINLKFGIRVDQPGTLLRDFHTAMDAIGSDGSKAEHPVISDRWYISDAKFLAGLEGQVGFLRQLHHALRHPVWSPCLGRKCCIPSLPLSAGSVVGAPLQQALEEAAALATADRFRLVLEDPTGPQSRPDQPISPFSQRRFGIRRVRTFSIPAPQPHP
jgi:CRISPR system Cascade subunit CasD